MRVCIWFYIGLYFFPRHDTDRLEENKIGQSESTGPSSWSLARAWEAFQGFHDNPRLARTLYLRRWSGKTMEKWVKRKRDRDNDETIFDEYVGYNNSFDNMLIFGRLSYSNRREG